jgi:uncharacterized damage-inducible protein DinB
METHTERIARLRQAYRDARARFFKRLSEAPADAVERSPGDGRWSAAQIGWHVAVVDSAFAGIISGEIPGAKELAEGESARPWAEIQPAIPGKLEAGKRVQPPPEAKQAEVLEALRTSAAKMDAALAGLDEARGARYAITHPVIGVVSLADVGEWATAHVIRHNAQAKRTLQS